MFVFDRTQKICVFPKLYNVLITNQFIFFIFFILFLKFLYKKCNRSYGCIIQFEASTYNFHANLVFFGQMFKLCIVVMVVSRNKNRNGNVAGLVNYLGMNSSLCDMIHGAVNFNVSWRIAHHAFVDYLKLHVVVFYQAA